MAATDSFQAEYNSWPANLPEGVDHVLGTGGDIAADPGGEKSPKPAGVRGKCALIEADYCNEAAQEKT